MMRKILLGAILLVALAASPAYAQYPPIVVSPGQVTPGGSVTITGSNCVPNSPITVTISPTDGVQRALTPSGPPIATVTTTSDANGQFSVDVVIPAGTPPGTYLVSATNCRDTNTTLEVLGADVTPPTTPPTTPGGNAPGGNAPGGNAPGGNAPGGNAPGSANQGGGNLPRTGSDLDRLGLLGAGLLTAGGLFLVATKRRRHARPLAA